MPKPPTAAPSLPGNTQGWIGAALLRAASVRCTPTLAGHDQLAN